MIDHTPVVSVIIATYNWSSVLRYAIQSVLWQTFQDFELLVIGDGCTDDTAEVVAAFDDARIRWHNLPKNTGHQSIPNNTGIAMARGAYVAYLGHDDLWYPTHLANLVAAAESTSADLAYSMAVMIGPEGSGIRSLKGVPKPDAPPTWIPMPIPSSVLHRQTLTSEIGGWREYRTIDLTPDIDLVKRAHAAGKRFAAVPELTAFKFPSAWRRNSYITKPSHEQADYARRIQTEPNFLYEEMKAIAIAYLRSKTEYAPIVTPAAAPTGWLVEQYRLIRGLEAKPLPEVTILHRLQILRKAINRRVPRRLRVVKHLRDVLRR